MGNWTLRGTVGSHPIHDPRKQECRNLIIQPFTEEVYASRMPSVLRALFQVELAGVGNL